MEIRQDTLLFLLLAHSRFGISEHIAIEHHDHLRHGGTPRRPHRVEVCTRWRVFAAHQPLIDAPAERIKRPRVRLSPSGNVLECRLVTRGIVALEARIIGEHDRRLLARDQPLTTECSVAISLNHTVFLCPQRRRIVEVAAANIGKPSRARNRLAFHAPQNSNQLSTRDVIVGSECSIVISRDKALVRNIGYCRCIPLVRIAVREIPHRLQLDSRVQVR